MGEVYRGCDTRLGRTVAIKILPSQFSADAVRKQRFEREAKIISGLNHPNICVFTAGILILRTCRLERRLHELQRACVAETEAEAKKQGTLSALASIFSGKMTCDPVELARSDSYRGIQGQLAAARRDVLRWASWPQISGIAVPLLCSLPWLWHFFLRRIRELREAIAGK
jgi:serine/threonine protein kinase